MSETGKKQTSRAEQQFREAFDRLRTNKPMLLPKGTPVSQNNVAKEAGVDPSALRSRRFPELAKEIKEWVAQSPAVKARRSRGTALEQKNLKIAALNERLDETVRQRDNALSKLSAANKQILDLVSEVHRLQAELASPNITSLDRVRRQRE